MERKELFILGTSTLVAAILAVTLLVPASPASAATAPDFKVAFMGDQGNNANALAVMALIKTEGAQVTLLNGDFDYGDDPEAWDANINSVLGVDYPLLGDVGNHDTTAWPGYQTKLEERIARNPGLDCHGEIGVQSYCYYNGVLFILSGVGTMEAGGIPVANSLIDPPAVVGDTGLLPKAHAQYIDEVLTNDHSMWRICNWHKNQEFMQIGGKSDEVGWAPYETCRNHGAPIMTGHEHSYERTRTLVNTQTQAVDPEWPEANQLRVANGSTFVVVSGLAGESVRPQLRCLPYAYPYGCQGEWAFIDTSNQGATYGALFCTFAPRGIEYLAECYYKDIQGRVRDTFTVVSELHGVPPPPAPVITLEGQGKKVKGVHTVDLTWTGARTTDVDLFRDNVKVATTGNDGAYTDSTGNRGGPRTYSFRVCEAAASFCSDDVPVTVQ